MPDTLGPAGCARHRLRALEKPLAHVVLGEHGNVRPLQELPRLNGQREHPFSAESSRLIVRSRSPSPGGRDVRANVRRCERRHAPAAEPRLQRALDHGRFEVVVGPLAVYRVVVQQILDASSNRSRPIFALSGRALGDIASRCFS